MLLSKKSYHTCGGTLHPESTMLRFNNVVIEVEEAEIMVFLSYQFNPKSEIDRLVDLFRNYKSKEIVLDFSCELFSPQLYERLILEESLSNLTIYTNGKPPDIESFDPLIERGCNVVVLPFFLKYVHYYTPVEREDDGSIIVNIFKKKR